MSAGSGVLRTCCGVAIVLLATVGQAHAQAGRSQVREGNRLFDEGRFEEAHQRYLEGLAEAPESGVLRFNDGNALYRSEDYQRALEAYRGALETGDPALAGAAWYNLGNALYRQQQLEESLEAYKQALRLDPSDVDAKHNLERVLEQMQQQQQQPQNGDQQQQDQEDEQQDQQDQQDRQQSEQQQSPEDRQEPQPGDQPPDEQQQPGQAEPRPGEMTPEEARRMLQAVEENPEEVNRPRAPVTGARPRRPW